MFVMVKCGVLFEVRAEDKFCTAIDELQLQRGTSSETHD
jgi:hypothetical protein